MCLFVTCTIFTILTLTALEVISAIATVLGEPLVDVPVGGRVVSRGRHEVDVVVQPLCLLIAQQAVADVETAVKAEGFAVGGVNAGVGASRQRDGVGVIAVGVVLVRRPHASVAHVAGLVGLEVAKDAFAVVNSTAAFEIIRHCRLVKIVVVEFIQRGRFDLGEVTIENLIGGQRSSIGKALTNKIGFGGAKFFALFERKSRFRLFHVTIGDSATRNGQTKAN